MAEVERLAKLWGGQYDKYCENDEWGAPEPRLLQ